MTLSWLARAFCMTDLRLKELWWFDANAKTYPYDPAKAKALLAEAGYPNGFEFTLSTPQIGIFQQINQLIQEQLAAIGVKLKLWSRSRKVSGMPGW